MKKRIISRILLLLVIFSLCIPSIAIPSYQNQTMESYPEIQPKIESNGLENGWYFLPSYQNYAPSGLPDFDQRQNSTWKRGFIWSFCGPVALANIFWWFDSKYEDEHGFPGDGKDDYPLVSNYNTYSDPLPGPAYDDHNFNNVNDLSTAWSHKPGSGELIEQLATYVDIYWHKIPFLTISGTDRYQLANGARKWIKDAGLENAYKIETIAQPSFSLIADRVQKNQGVILQGGYYIPRLPKIVSLISGHFFAVAGVHPDGYIAISDSLYDIANETDNYTLHNDPQYVSHDIFKISDDPPYPKLAKWWIPSFQRYRRVLIRSAIIISEKNEEID
ncbi:MAG: hypothetical protein KGY65_03530 [Candidatus Thermoplasmatota archaeon]|nr:hypothetical protein [Candidatus Thermoplasmatota archaeon]MBS3801800.1 hypothetical protein [Candidatus Thermoplasmatota archaeon]